MENKQVSTFSGIGGIHSSNYLQRNTGYKYIILTEQQIQEIVSQSIRIMQESCKDKDGKSLFQNMTEQQIKAFLTDPDRMNHRKTPRIELRTVPNGEIVQIGVIFQNTVQRNQIMPLFTNKKNIQCLAGGQTTIEISAAGINKALPIGFIDEHFDEILEQIAYRPDPKKPINAYLNRTIVVSDGDDTIYGKPTARSHIENNLGNSPAKEALIDYLEAGGIYTICSGNDLERTRVRIMEGIPVEKHHLLSQIIVVGCGGATLCTFAPNTALVEFKAYRKKALCENNESKVKNLDVVYLGDDAAPLANDFPAFKKVGFERAICVSLLQKEKIPAELQQNFVGGTMDGTRAFLEQAVEFAKKNPGQKIFEPQNIGLFVREARQNLITETKTAVTSRKIVVFSGGSGPQKLVPHLNQFFGVNNIKYIMANTDDGGSTGVLIKYFPDEYMLGLGDYRNRVTAISQNAMVKKVLDYRLPDTAEKATIEWQELLHGEHRLLQDLSADKKAIVLKSLVRFEQECQKKDKPFDFVKASIGNLILTGLWFIFFKDANLAVNELCRLADVPRGVIVPSSLDGDCTLAAKLSDGTKILGQDEISHPSSGNAVDKDHVAAMNARLRRVHIIRKSKIQKKYLSALESLNMLKCTQRPNQKALRAIRQADMVVFSRGSLATSLVPALLTERIGEEIIRHKGKKVFITNGSVDRETSGLTLSEYILTAVMAMNKNQPLLDNKEITKYVTHVVVPDGSPFYKEEESRKLEEWGIKIITAPATKPKLDTAFYDDAALAKLLDQI